MLKLKLLRNATLKLEVAGRTILVDPFFAPKHSRPSLAGRSPNPLVDLPESTDAILDSVELVVVSHLHGDHFDPVAQDLVPKHLPVICQPGDEGRISGFGFEDVTPLADEIDWHGLHFRRREARHGTGPVVEKMGPVIGFTLSAPGEPVLYWAGDTVLYPPVEATIREAQPDVIVLHPCAALWEGDLIVMTAEDALTTCEVAPNAAVVAVHLDALDHATAGRAELRALARSRELPAGRLLIPKDGEVLEFRAGG